VTRPAAGSVLFAWLRPTPPFFYGGAEVSCRMLAAEMVSAGWKVSHVGSYTNPRFGHDLRLREFAKALPREALRTCAGRPALRYVRSDGRATMVHRDAFAVCVEIAMREARPALVVVAGEGAELVVRVARRSGATTVAWAMDTTRAGPVAARAGADVTVYASQFLRDQLVERGGSPGSVVYPPFAAPALPTFRRSRRGRPRVVMVNPIREKGVDVFLALARLRPCVEFRTFEAWRDPDWDPREVPENVSYRPRTDVLDREYLAADVAIVPSRLPEGFGRVPVEAGLCGTPALCTAVGGLPEACPEPALLSGWEPAEWVEALDRTLDPSCWWRRAVAARRHALPFARPRLPGFLRLAGV
jgi:glycosyltransferase involved in cell wall biosynthesis